MIMSREPSLLCGITPHESYVERAYLSMHKQTNKWMTKPYWYYTLVNKLTIVLTLNTFAFMSDHYQEVTGIYYLHLSNPLTIIMFITFNWSSLLSMLTWLCCCTGVFFHELLHVNVETYKRMITINFAHKNKYQSWFFMVNWSFSNILHSKYTSFFTHLSMHSQIWRQFTQYINIL